MDTYKLKHYISVCKRLDISNMNVLLDNIKTGGDLSTLINFNGITNDELGSTKKLCETVDLPTLKNIYSDYHTIVGGARKRRRNKTKSTTSSTSHPHNSKQKKNPTQKKKRNKSGDSSTDSDSFSFAKSETTDGASGQRLTRSQKKKQRRDNRLAQKQMKSSSSEGTLQSSSDGSTTSQKTMSKRQMKKERRRQRQQTDQANQTGQTGQQQKRQMSDIIDLSSLTDLSDGDASLSDTSDVVDESTHVSRPQSARSHSSTTKSIAHDLLKTGLESGIQGLVSNNDSFKAELRKMIQSTLKETVSEVLTEQIAPELEQIVITTTKENEQRGGFNKDVVPSELASEHPTIPSEVVSDHPAVSSDKKNPLTYETIYDHNKIVEIGSDICYCSKKK